MSPLRVSRALLDAPEPAAAGALRVVRVLADAPEAVQPPAAGGLRVSRALLDAPEATPSSEWVPHMRIGGTLVVLEELERRGGVLR